MVAKHVQDENFEYSSFPGEALYREELFEWFFSGQLEEEKKQGRISTIVTSGREQILFLLNNPCQNPTGYSLAKEEWETLVFLLSSYRGRSIVAVGYRLSRFRFGGDERRDRSRALFFKRRGMSFSKTFSFYGLRIGALSLFAPNKEQAELTFKKAKQGARALWSTADRMAMNVIANLLSHADTKEEMKK